MKKVIKIPVPKVRVFLRCLKIHLIQASENLTRAKILRFSAGLILFFCVFTFSTDAVDAVEVDVVNIDGRDFLLFSSQGMQFGSYLRAGHHQNADGEMVKSKGIWNVKNGYNGMRMANEGNYSEWLLGYESSRDGQWWGGAYFRIAFDIEDYYAGFLNVSDDIFLPEAMLRFGFSDWNFWAGRRYNDKIAVGMMDYYVAVLDGNGGGIENLKLSNGLLDINWIYSYDNQGGNAFSGKNTLGFVLKDIKTESGNLAFIAAPSVQTGGGAAAGAFLSVKYNTERFLKWNGSTEYFASVGFGTGAGQHTDYSVREYEDWSVLGGLQGSAQISEELSFRFTGYYEHRSWNDTAVDNEHHFLSAGLRPMYMITPVFGIQAEYDFEMAADSRNVVNRLTLAPTFTPPGGSVNSNLQFYAYVSVGFGDFTGGDTLALTPGSSTGLSWGLAGHIGF